MHLRARFSRAYDVSSSSVRVAMAMSPRDCAVLDDEDIFSKLRFLEREQPFLEGTSLSTDRRR